MENKAELKGPEAFRQFALAGRAIFTIRSRETGNRFTYRIRVAKGTPGVFFVDFLGGADNTNDWRWLGTLKPRGNTHQFVHGLAHARAGADAMVTIAFGWAWRHPESEKLEVWHEGRCGRCGRRLTVPESIESGLGPSCAGKVAA